MIQVGQYGGLEDDVAALKRDKGVLMSELVRLRQQQQQTDAAVRLMQRRLATTEQQQTQMLSFLSNALQNPALLQQLVASGLPQMMEDIASPGTPPIFPILGLFNHMVHVVLNKHVHHFASLSRSKSRTG